MSSSVEAAAAAPSLNDTTTPSTYTSTANTPTTSVYRVQERVPQAVREAIQSFQPPDGFILVPPRAGETSMIYSWGVRLASEDQPETFSWVCLASETCRRNLTRQLLSSGKTSKATRHLSLVHGRSRSDAESSSSFSTTSSSTFSSAALSSTAATSSSSSSSSSIHGVHRKRDRSSWLQELRQSELFHSNPIRLYVLLEVLRIVHNRLPFCLGEYDESLLLQELTVKQEMQVGVRLDASAVAHAIVELYASTRREISGLLADSHVGGRAPSFCLATAFSPSLPKQHQQQQHHHPGGANATVIGARIYFVDAQFIQRSVLLGVRHFEPRAKGMRALLQRWLADLLRDFGLTPSNVFAATSDDGQWTVEHGFGLQYEPSLAHLTTQVTKSACGLVGEDHASSSFASSTSSSSSVSENPALTALIGRVATTIYQTRHTETLGSLFRELRELLYNSSSLESSSSDSVSPPRVSSLSDTIERVLSSWDALEDWYARPRRLVHVAFPLASDYTHLCQLLSLLKPLTMVTKRSEAHGPTQVETFMTLLALRRSVLHCGAPLKDYRWTAETPLFISVAELTPVVSFTRELLQQKLDHAFFCRYTDRAVYSSGASASGSSSATSSSSGTQPQCSFVPEMQTLLHPLYKKSVATGLKEVVLLSHGTAGRALRDAKDAFDEMEETVHHKLTTLMLATATATSTTTSDGSATPGTAGTFGPDVAVRSQVVSAEIEDMTTISPFSYRQLTALDAMAGAMPRIHDKYTDELARWLSDPSPLAIDAGGCSESVLAFWRRMAAEAKYPSLSRVARTLFAVPTSSSQLASDLAKAQATVAAHRVMDGSGHGSTRLLPHFVDMCAFLNCNRAYVDVNQCAQIPAHAIGDHVPSNVALVVEQEHDGRAPEISDFVASFLAETQV